MARARRWLDSQSISSPQPSPPSTRSSDRLESSKGHSPLTSVQSSPAQTRQSQHLEPRNRAPDDQLLTTSSIYNFLLQTELGDLTHHFEIDQAGSSQASPEPSSAHSQAQSTSLHGWLGASRARAQPSLRAKIAQAGWPPRQQRQSSAASSSQAHEPDSFESSVKQPQLQISTRRNPASPARGYAPQILSSTSSVQRLITEEPSSHPQLEDLRETSFTQAISEPCTFDSAGEVPDSAHRRQEPDRPPKLPDSDALVFTVLDGELVPDLPKQPSKVSFAPASVAPSELSPNGPSEQPHKLSPVQPAEQDIEAQREHHGCYTGQDCFFGIGACISDRVKGLRGAGQPPPARAPFLQVSMRTLAHLPAPERDIRMIQTAPMGSYDLGERGQNFEQL
ncbi:hypothetical protein WJX84_007250 [Apatococcus fuscideae]|uniref:Uncharacterized protein n=1 Tax=Apatococcus fuscideae TaxID=2026836 RepID=A0AAW1SYC0_9CHLO